ncbi:cytochrome bd-I oxidase subunit CydX [Kaistia geumhonensis]|uniref:Cyd operon protein YbgT n=1 Tax=Kaistia geumhonensis TaxID=410839 RepID=A0ABU0M2E2_9HYPH|nr:cytochrome bd-I oxidase subunit CydX [Kaistia geumhonensis]MCX5479652.1 cytochrome bd-I oxidase subunit CydX [Kaistia geumhonensis]MDQ0515124.1 cyd operon protein YbgT [Kaistia geumhonensis]
MWYFSWILGISLACAFAILNAMWYEMRDDALTARKVAASPSPKRR